MLTISFIWTSEAGGDIPLTHPDENLTPREIENSAELAYFLCVPIEVF